MSVFVDTSALLAVADADDQFHHSAQETWVQLLDGGDRLVTTNYVALETTALFQRRLGLAAVRILNQAILPVVEMLWISKAIHDVAVSTLLSANRRQLSLVDLTSFAVMRGHVVESAFTFDRHFAQQGFSIFGNL